MIDVTTLTNLITQFRNTTASNSVSPETVGSILQKIVDILATAGTQANIASSFGTFTLICDPGTESWRFST